MGHWQFNGQDLDLRAHCGKSQYRSRENRDKAPLARLIGQWLSERLGQLFVIENRPGDGSNIATEAVVRAPTDGYTLLLVGSPNAINATLRQTQFQFIRDIAPVASFIRGALVLVVHPSVPANTVPQFIAYAKANPSKLSYG